MLYKGLKEREKKNVRRIHARLMQLLLFDKTNKNKITF